jgi:hypothetical protein
VRLAARAATATLAAALASLTAALSLGPGCAATTKVAPPAPEFTAEALRTGGLVDLGVVQVNEIVSVRPPLIAALEKVLTATRPDIPFTNAARAQAMMGDSTTRLLLLGYELHGIPEQSWLARAADSLHAIARFGVLARVESDGVSYSKREVPSTSTSGDPYDKVTVTEREAKVAVVVFDLKTLASVFSGVYVGTSEAAMPDTMPRPTMTPNEMPPPNTQTNPLSPPGSTGPPGGPGGPGWSAAEPPPLSKAVEGAFLEWVRTLPGSAPGTGTTPP